MAVFVEGADELSDLGEVSGRFEVDLCACQCSCECLQNCGLNLGISGVQGATGPAQWQSLPHCVTASSLQDGRYY